jgi:hypothetical protein
MKQRNGKTLLLFLVRFKDATKKYKATARPELVLVYSFYCGDLNELNCFISIKRINME